MYNNHQRAPTSWRLARVHQQKPALPIDAVERKPYPRAQRSQALPSGAIERATSPIAPTRARLAHYHTCARADQCRHQPRHMPTLATTATRRSPQRHRSLTLPARASEIIPCLFAPSVARPTPWAPPSARLGPLVPSIARPTQWMAPSVERLAPRCQAARGMPSDAIRGAISRAPCPSASTRALESAPCTCGAVRSTPCVLAPSSAIIAPCAPTSARSAYWRTLSQRHA